MYQGAWNSLPDFIAHDWPAYKGETSLTDMAASVCGAANIRDGDILVGSSLGGMVACEILKIRRIPGLFLVGSAISPNEINLIFSILQPLSGVALLKMLQQVAGNISSVATRMFADADVNFMRTMIGAIFKWQGLGATQTMVHRIHGRHDFVIPLPDNVDLAVEGGHLIAMTHAEACVNHLRRNVLQNI